AVRTPVGPATLALRARSGEVHATAWGAGAEHALDAVPRLCGAEDADTGIDASGHTVVAESARRNQGLRLARTDAVFDALAGAVLEQKVTSLQAFSAWRVLVTRFGARAPGPSPRALFVPPSPEGWRAIPSWAWH